MKYLITYTIVIEPEDGQPLVNTDFLEELRSNIFDAVSEVPTEAPCDANVSESITLGEV